MSAPDPYEQSLSAALCDREHEREFGVDWLALIQRHQLLINCHREGVVIHTADGLRVSGADLRAVLQEVIFVNAAQPVTGGVVPAPATGH